MNQQQTKLEWEEEVNQNLISSMLYPECEKMCEELIDCVRRSGSGINRFALRIFLLRAARFGYDKALNNKTEPHA